MDEFYFCHDVCTFHDLKCFCARQVPLARSQTCIRKLERKEHIWDHKSCLMPQVVLFCVTKLDFWTLRDQVTKPSVTSDQAKHEPTLSFLFLALLLQSHMSYNYSFHSAYRKFRTSEYSFRQRLPFFCRHTEQTSSSAFQIPHIHRRSSQHRLF